MLGQVGWILLGGNEFQEYFLIYYSLIEAKFFSIMMINYFKLSWAVK
jgi:hypothetical protein